MGVSSYVGKRLSFSSFHFISISIFTYLQLLHILNLTKEMMFSLMYILFKYVFNIIKHDKTLVVHKCHTFILN